MERELSMSKIWGKITGLFTNRTFAGIDKAGNRYFAKTEQIDGISKFLLPPTVYFISLINIQSCIIPCCFLLLLYMWNVHCLLVFNFRVAKLQLVVFAYSKFYVFFLTTLCLNYMLGFGQVRNFGDQGSRWPGCRFLQEQ